MLVAALYDIHGNLPALEAVLDDVRRAGVTQIVAGGDVILGPMSREALDRLLDLEIPVQFIQGNCEAAVLAQMGGETPAVPSQVKETVQWTATTLTPEHQRLISRWPKTLTMEIPGSGRILFCHATPRSDNEMFTRLTPDEHLAPMFAGVDADLVVCGHSHMQFDRRFGEIRIINAGSVGMPFGQPGADWLLLGEKAELRHTNYDLTKAAERVRATAYPQANEFAEKNVLHPPTEEAMLALLQKSGVK